MVRRNTPVDTITMTVFIITTSLTMSTQELTFYLGGKQPHKTQCLVSQNVTPIKILLFILLLINKVSENKLSNHDAIFHNSANCALKIFLFRKNGVFINTSLTLKL